MKPGLKILLLFVVATLVRISYALWEPESESDFIPKKIDLSP